MLESAGSIQRSSLRPIPLIGRSDLVVSTVFYRGVQHFVVKDPVGLKYHRLSGEQFRMLSQLDGTQTLESLREALLREFPASHPTLRELQQLAADLHQKGLTYTQRPGQGETRSQQFREHRGQQIRQVLLNLLSLRLPGWDPDRFLQRLLPFVDWMFRPWGVALCLAFVIASGITLGLHWNEYRQSLPAFEQFFGWPNLIFLWLTMAVAKVLHEFGHGLSCRYFGSECHEMGVMLLVFSPCLYCDVTDSWMLPNKWQRIIIGGAGVYVEVILSALAIFIWQATSTGMLHYLSLNLFFVTAVTTVIFNANPLMKLDGYYMLSDLLEIPNLRPQADRFLRETFGHSCLGIEISRDPFAPQSGRLWFMIFAVASYLYGWMVLGGVLLFLYSVLKPYGLQIIGQAAASFSIGSMIFGGLLNLYRIISAPRSKPLSRFRVAATVSAVAGLLLVAILIPIPWYRTSACMIEPKNVSHVVNKVPGQIEEIHVRSGDFVREGDILICMIDPDWQSRLNDLQIKIRVQKAEIKAFAALNDRSSQIVSMEVLNGLKDEEQEVIEHLRHLTIVAPCDGRVVSVPRHPATSVEQQETRLPTWESTPLDPRNQGAFLPERTQLLSIAPVRSPDESEQFQAVIYLDQSDLLDLRDKMKMRIKFDYDLSETFNGAIRHIGPAETETVPSELTIKQGGSLTTVTDKTGRERLTDPAYQAIVDLDQTSSQFRTGLRGRARILIFERSIAGWLWRWIRRTFHFNL